MDKLTKNARYVVHTDTSFALRGLLDGTPGYGRMSGLSRQLPSRELLGGHRTITQIPRGIPRLANTSQLRILPDGSRLIHGSRILSESTRGIVSNRPLSPHLPVKKPQPSAMFSISHRIFGAALTSFIMLIPVVYEFTLIYDI